MKKYHIRAICFMYNDEYHFPFKGFGGIEKSFDNLEDATQAIKEMNCKRMRGLRPDDYEPISYCYKGNNPESIELDKYLQNTFGQKFLIPSTYSDGLMTDRDYHFPNDLTIEQAWEIREISGIRHFEIIEMEGDDSGFWGIKTGRWMKTPNDWMKGHAHQFNQLTHEYKEGQVPLFFNSEQDTLTAMENLVHGITRLMQEDGVKGSLEELSEAPIMLQAVIDQNENLTYDETTQQLKIGWLQGDQFNILNGLLKEPIVKVVPFPMSEIEKMGTGWQPAM